MFKISTVLFPDKDQEEFPETYQSPIEAINAFSQKFEMLDHSMTYMPVLILSYNGREIHKEAKPMYRELDVARVFQSVSKVL